MIFIKFYSIKPLCTDLETFLKTPATMIVLACVIV